MKELSVEEKAKAYDEAKARMSMAYNDNRCTIGFMNEIFPELQESEDERIREEMIEILKKEAHDFPSSVIAEKSNSWIAWLEKQGEQNPQKTLIWKHWKDGIAGNEGEKLIYLVKEDNTYKLTSCLWFECDYIELSELDKLLSKEQGKQNPIDKPKFKVGDVIKPKDPVLGEPRIIKGIHPKFGYDTNNGILDFEFEDNWELVEQKPTDKVEPKFKVGDFIVNDYCMGRVIEITNDAYLLDTEQGIPLSHEHNAHLWTIQDAKDGDVLIDKSNNRECPFIFKETKPSTIKTECLNSLTVLGYCGIGGVGFTKGSGWGDTANCIYYPATKEQRDQLEKAMADAGYTFDFEKKKLKKIENPTVWSEEDEQMLKAAINSCEQCGNEYVYYWLKSLKERYTWKPSDEQMLALDDAIETYCGKYKVTLTSFYNVLKKLTE